MEQAAPVPEERLPLVGCGILRREVRWLVEKNGWPIDTTFLGSSHHCDFDRFGARLTAALRQNAARRTIVCYGACHPLMDDFLAEVGALRIEGQNCAEMLLGHRAFTEELQAGAYFLLEDWARNWPRIVSATFRTTNLALIREIFHLDRRYLLALRTPLSGDFTDQAVDAGRLVALPVRWRDVPLDHLETILAAAVRRRIGQSGGRT